MPALYIRKTEGDCEHILVRDGQTQVAAHVQLPRGETVRRVVVAMPAGKAALCFDTDRPTQWALADEIATFADDGGQRGVAFTLAAETAEVSIPVSSVLLHHTLMARFGVDPGRKHENRLRDLIQSGEIRDVESRLEIPLRDLADRGQIVGPVLAEPGRAVFTKRALDGKHRYRLELIAPAPLRLRVSGGRLRISHENPSRGTPVRLTIRASTDFAPLTPLPFDELANERGRACAGKDPLFAQAMRHFEFLSFREKYLAGSWNFLSYFGRDTLIALRLMWPVLSPQAKQIGLQSVANETAAHGAVNVTDEWTDDRTAADALEVFFREFDAGNLETARRIMKTILAGNVPEHPFFDVLDPTFLFPSAAAHWFREMDDGSLAAWLTAEHPVLGRTESNLATLLRNWNYILKSAAPYVAAWKHLRAKHPDCAPRQIVAAYPDEFRETRKNLVRSIAGAANWRDTYNLPWHFVSEDINVNLLPMALAAIQEMLARIGAAGGRLEPLAVAKRHSLDVVGAYLEDPRRCEAAKEAWDRDLMRAHFLVRRTVAEMRRDLARYLDGLANGDVFGEDRARGIQERDALLRRQESGVTVAEFLPGNRVPAPVQDGLAFTALLLAPDGRPLPLMHGDDVFFLLFGNPTLAQVREILRPLVLAYPFGLGFLEDDLGLAVTNAVFSPRDDEALQDKAKNVWVKFGPDEYHGRAAWPWVMFALIGGIHAQTMNRIDNEGRLAPGVGADDVGLFRNILAKMKSSLARLGPLATSEVFKFSPAASGGGIWQAEPMGISTPIQLWSAAPAMMLIDEALERLDLAQAR